MRGRLRRPKPTSTLLLLLMLGATACSAPTPEASSTGLVVERTTEDGVPVVRTVSGSRWGSPARLVEEVVIGGPEATEDEYIFGSAWSVWSTEDEIFVLDGTVPVVRVFGRDGRHLRDIGRGGQGPGEFTQPNGVVTDEGGRVLVLEAPAHRLHLFTADGAVEDTWSWSSSGYAITSPSLIASPEAGAWVFTFSPPEGGDLAAARSGYMLVGPDGAGAISYQPDIPGYEPLEVRVDTPTRRRTYDWVVPFAPKPIRAMDRNGVWYVGSGDSYRFWALAPDGSRRAIERYWTPVNVQPEEAEAHLRRAEADVRRMSRMPEWNWSGPAPAATKQAYTLIHPDYSDRIWVERPGVGSPIDGCVLEEALEERGADPCWSEKRFWDVFTTEGEYLGEVEVPEGAPMLSTMNIQGDRITYSRPDALGNPQLVRYRLEIPGDRETTD